jgi:hypothetical protein
VQPLEPPRQQRQLILSKHIKPLIWHRHQRGQSEHLGGWVRVSISFRPTNEGKTMGISRTLELGSYAPIHLSRC